MLEAIHRISSRVSTKDAFMDDELVQVWVVHHLEILGEAAGDISDHLRDRALDVPWTAITAQRNLLVHAYFHVDVHEVWKTVERDLPALSEQLGSLVETLST